MPDPKTTTAEWDGDVTLACPQCKDAGRVTEIDTRHALTKSRIITDAGVPAIRWTGIPCAECGGSFTLEATKHAPGDNNA